MEIHGNPCRSTRSTLQNLICYRMSVSRASGTPCGSVFGRFCVSRCQTGATGVNFNDFINSSGHFGIDLGSFGGHFGVIFGIWGALKPYLSQFDVEKLEMASVMGICGSLVGPKKRKY